MYKPYVPAPFHKGNTNLTFKVYWKYQLRGEKVSLKKKMITRSVKEIKKDLDIYTIPWISKAWYSRVKIGDQWPNSARKHAVFPA